MEKLFVAVRFLLVAIVISTYLSGCGGGSDSSTTNSATSTAKTASWTNVSVRALDGKVNINWDRAPGSSFGTVLSTYNIYRSTNPNDIVQDRNRIQTNFTGTSFDDTSVDYGSYYFYAVSEINAAGEGPASRLVSAAPQVLQPAAPYGLKVTAIDNSVKLEFMGPTPPSNVVVNYYLYRSTSRDLANPTINPFTLPSYTDTNFSYGTTYYYSLKAVVAGKESVFSPISAARPQKTIRAVDNTPVNGLLAAFSSPTDMSATPGDRSCTIKWTDVLPLKITGSDAVGSTSPSYILYWSDSPDVIANKISQRVIDSKDVTSDGFTLTGLNNSATYYFQIAAAIKNDAAGALIQGRYTAGPVVAATPGLKTPAIPAGVSATQGTKQVLLSWNKDNSGLSGVTYNIYFSTTDAIIGGPAKLMATGDKKNTDSSKTYFTHSGDLKAGQTYFYVVTAVVGEAESAPSSIVAVSL